MTPVRTCVGCGQRSPQPSVHRFVQLGDRLVLDGGRRAPGRGAYLHSNATCWATFVRRRGPVRSLRTTPDRAAREALTAIMASATGA